jgi:hypothetical protein
MDRLSFVAVLVAAWPVAAAPRVIDLSSSSVPDAGMTHFRIEAIILSDDDGRSRARVDPIQINAWVARANTDFAGAGVRFDFRPEEDVTELHSTLLNRMEMDHLPGSKQEAAALKLAADYRHKIPVLFRFGHGHNKSNAFSNQRFVVMTGFDELTACGGQNLASLLAHELGHFFGLLHTHKAEFDSPAQADAWIRQMIAHKQSIDGDGFADTPPTPFIRRMQCGDNDEIMLAGHPYKIPRGNIMSYYEAADETRNHKSFSPKQIEHIREVAQTQKHRLGDEPTSGAAPAARH